MATDNENAPPTHQPYVPDNVTMPEFTWSAVLVGAILGIVFGASSLYLLLKVGMTVSASVPIAVLSITLFRAFANGFGVRRATILENNVVQTTGSAGESIAFGVGVTMPALLLLGFEMSWERVMTVAVLGGLLGVLLMIPLRRAFIVKQHGKLKYPEGTACAEVLVAGEKGGSSARMVFIGFGIALVHKFLTKGLRLWPDEPEQNLYTESETGEKFGLKGASVGGELSPEMLGVGYLIGPRISCMMMAGAVLSFFVIGPLIATFGEGVPTYVAPAMKKIDEKSGLDKGLIKNMGPGEIYSNYLRYIGAGAVAAGGIISMFRALPLILASIIAGVRDLRGGVDVGGQQRTERDISIQVVAFGCLGLVIVLAAVPQLGLGLSIPGVLGAIMILVFGFLFVTVSSRLTGEVGSSSNPISGMTIATLLLTCLIFFVFGLTGVQERLTAMSIAAVVCIASSNGGTTSQDLKTGYLVGATPKFQQWAILIGALTSAIVIGGTMLMLNAAGTHYTKKNVPNVKLSADLLKNAPEQKVGRPYDGSDAKLQRDDKIYRFVYARQKEGGKIEGVPPAWYLAAEDGQLVYRADTPIKRESKQMDNGSDAPEKFKAPQPQLFQLITEGILGGDLQWGLIIVGVLVAVAMELLGISALPVAVGMYLGLSTAMPIFVGGMLRWLTDRIRGVSASEAETETSPGVLFSSGYIAGGTLCGLLLGFVFMVLSPDVLDLGKHLGEWYTEDIGNVTAVLAFAVLAFFLARIGIQKSEEPPPTPPPSGKPDTRITS